MAKLTYYTSFEDLKTDEVHKSQNHSESAKESELKAFLALLSKYRYAQKQAPTLIVACNTIVPVDQTLFPEKLEKAKQILGKTKFLSR